MTIAQREQQILRVRQQGFHADLDIELAERLRSEVVNTVKTVLESALRRGERISEAARG